MRNGSSLIPASQQAWNLADVSTMQSSDVPRESYLRTVTSGSGHASGVVAAASILLMDACLSTHYSYDNTLLVFKLASLLTNLAT